MAACQSWICSPCCKSCVYGICAFVLRCFFFCSQTVLQMEHSLGVKIFFSSSLSSCKSCIFLNTLSPVLSTPLSYVCCVCMDRLIANFAGTCTSDNKGLLLDMSYTGCKNSKRLYESQANRHCQVVSLRFSFSPNVHSVGSNEQNAKTFP